MLALLLGSACGLPSEPGQVFDGYMEAYTAGDVERMWELSSPAARADVERFRNQLLEGLEHPDAVVRVHYQGMVGASAEELKPLTNQQFFYWAVAMIRRRVGGVGAVRAELSRIVRVRIVDLDSTHKVVVYRQADQVRRLVLVEVPSGKWRIDQSPFPQPASKKRPRVEDTEPPGPDESEDETSDDVSGGVAPRRLNSAEFSGSGTMHTLLPVKPPVRWNCGPTR